MKGLYNQEVHEYSDMSEHLNIVSGWTRQIKNGQQPRGTDLHDHLTLIHNHNAGFTEALAWSCRDVNGKNSYELLADIIDPSCHGNVLDLACGSGVLLDYCNERFGSKLKLSGIDMNDAELILARERLAHTDTKLHRGMAQDLGFMADSTVDVILCHWALTLMDPVVPVFLSVERVLREGGVFAALVDGDPNTAPGYLEISKIIYKYVQRQYPDYGAIELGDPRIRTMEGLNELAMHTFIDPDITITPGLVSLNAAPEILARQVAGFFYASFVLSVTGHSQMIDDLENYFCARLNNGLSCFVMPINRLIVRKNK